jgi:hypothetical protein
MTFKSHRKIKKTNKHSKSDFKKKVLQKSLKKQKNKPYIVTHWYASLNFNGEEVEK